MNTVSRLIIKLVSGLATLYFCLVWAKAVSHPNWLPDEMEPLAALIGSVLFLISWYEEAIEIILRMNKKVKIHIVKSIIRASRPWMEGENKHQVYLYCLIENPTDRELAIKTMNLSLAKSKENIKFWDNSFEMRGNSFFFNPPILRIIPMQSTKPIELIFYTPSTDFDIREKLVGETLYFEVDIVDHKMIKKTLQLNLSE